MKYKVGIIGYGKMGKIRHKSVDKLTDAEVVMIYDPQPMQNIPPTIELKNSPSEVLSSSIDIVFICTPNKYIKPLTIEALQNGIHVFAEKPPGMNLEEALEIQLHESKNPRIKLMFGFNHRHHESVKKMKKVIDDNTLGKLLWMRGRYGKEVDENYLHDWRVDLNQSGGGILLDQGIHMLDLFLFLGGDFDEIKAFVSNLYWELPGIEDNVFAIFRNSISGLCASLHSTMTQWRYLFSLELFFEKGSLILNGLKTSSGAYGDEILTIRENEYPFIAGKSNKEEQIKFTDDYSWDSEVEHFFSSIKENTTPKLGNSNDAVRLMRIINTIYQNKSK